MFNKILWILLAAVLAGCATTGDPTQGGIFWSEKKAIERQEQLQQNLANEERQGHTLRQETINLESQRNVSKAELEKQRKRLNSLDTEICAMSGKINRYRADTAAKREKKQRLQDEIRTFDQRIDALRRDTRLSVQEKKRKIDILNQEVDNLLKIVSAL